jgi:ribonuclease T2
VETNTIMELRNVVRNGLIALAIVATVSSAALAQRPYGSGRPAESRNVAGKFDYYALVLSWSPSYCSATGLDRGDAQCTRTDGKRYSFVMHGLWPQFSPRGWPQDCPVRGRAFVPRPVISSMLDIMPSDKLVIHEYRKHGTCSGLEPTQYFDLSRKLFTTVTIPSDYVNTFEAKFVSPDDLITDFLKANAWLKRDMIAVSCDRGAGNPLTEVRICFSKDGQPTTCSRNEDQRKLCSAAKMYLPPVRSTNPNAPAKDQRTPVPRPQLIPNARNI